MSRQNDDPAGQGSLTRLVRTGRNPSLTGPFVNPPVVHASTVLFDEVEAMRPGGQKYIYGRQGTPTIDALESAIAEIEQAAGAVLCPSGLNAVSTALLSVLSSGDHLLVADNVYDPTRRFVTTVLAKLGIETTFFDPQLGAGIADLFRANTRAVYVESPGSLTFEMTDIPAVSAAAHARDALVISDGTWATPLYFKALRAGADLSVQAGTKYISGHSDVMLGTVAANAVAWERLKTTHAALGLCVGPDDIYLALRGLRTMGIRLERHAKTAREIADWLAGRPEVGRVLYPSLPSHPGHALWKRDMTGASGLFGVLLNGWSSHKTAAFLNGLALFGRGYSWGGFESLAIPARITRSAVPWVSEDSPIRLHAGLEDPKDLIEDLRQGFERVANMA